MPGRGACHGAHIDFDNPADSSAQVTIQSESVNTHNEDRDKHLRTNDFFDAPNHPKIPFTSTKVRKVGDAFGVDGDLSIKGVSKPVSIDLDYEGSAQDPFGNTRVGFEGKLTVDRRDWGLEWNAPLDTGGVLVGEKVTLEFEISALRAAPEAG